MKSVLAIAALLLSVTAHADDAFSTYKANITRDGKTSVLTIQNFWSGEYPGPVVDINAKKKGKTTVIPAYKSLRDLSGKTSCEVKNGVYHGWSRDKTSAIEYYSVVALIEYTAKKDLVLTEAGNLAMKKGDKISEVVYFGEGLSGAVLESNGKRKAFDFSFEALDNVDGLEMTANAKDEESDIREQWIRVKCANGEKLFTNVVELLNTKGVQEGSILGYGEVGPAGAEIKQ